MAYFRDADEVYGSIGKLFREIADDDALAARFRKADTVIQYSYEQPESVITVDLTGDGSGQVDFGDTSLSPEVVMRMEADTAHRFWLGEVNPTAALARGQIKASGPMAKVLRLAPLAKPLFPSYRRILADEGFEHLLAE